MNAERIHLNKLYVIRGRGVARCMRAGQKSSRPTMLWVHEEPVAPEDVMREAGMDDVPVRLHSLLFGNAASPAPKNELADQMSR